MLGRCCGRATKGVACLGLKCATQIGRFWEPEGDDFAGADGRAFVAEALAFFIDKLFEAARAGLPAAFGFARVLGADFAMLASVARAIAEFCITDRLSNLRARI